MNTIGCVCKDCGQGAAGKRCAAPPPVLLQHTEQIEFMLLRCVAGVYMKKNMYTFCYTFYMLIVCVIEHFLHDLTDELYIVLGFNTVELF